MPNHPRYSSVDSELGSGKGIGAIHYAIHSAIYFSVERNATIASGASDIVALSGCSSSGSQVLDAADRVHMRIITTLPGYPWRVKLIENPEWRRAAAPGILRGYNHNRMVTKAQSELYIHGNPEFVIGTPYNGTVVMNERRGGANAGNAAVSDAPGQSGDVAEWILDTDILRTVPPQNPAAPIANGYVLSIDNNTGAQQDITIKFEWYEFDNT